MALIAAAVAALILQDIMEPQAGVRALASIPLYAFIFLCILGLAEILHTTGLRRTSAWIFHFLFALQFFACFLFDAFYEDAVHRRYSILDADSGNVFYLLGEVIPFTVLSAFAFVLALVYACALLLRRIFTHRSFLTAALGFILTGAAALQADTPTLHAYFLRDMQSYANDAPVTETILPVPTDERVFFDKDARAWKLPGRSKRILLFVMESVTAEVLTQNCREGDCVFQSHAGLAHRYENYFSANQDSRTGILSLLFSRFIPYPAYPERDVRAYEHLKNRPSLLDTFKAAGYKTAFAASVLEKERVLAELPWDKRFFLTPEEAKTQTKSDSNICLNPYEFEHSCEDQIFLDRLVEFVSREPRVFLLQEFLYGHTGEYVRIRGRTSAAYYGAYIQKFMRRLEERGLLDDTLIIVTSDHGERNPSGLRSVENYRLPLYFFRKGQGSRVNRDFLAPMDFARILAAEESDRVVTQSERPFVPIMGSTGSGIVGLVSGDRRLLLIKNRRWGARVMMNETGPALPAPARLLGHLEWYRSIFPSL